MYCSHFVLHTPATNICEFLVKPVDWNIFLIVVTVFITLKGKGN